ncbi:hypothetical protein [Cronobacter sakazakii]|uniref:hypothetical protein n=1 Tax=Cronobacter sakazakii TaxID=28141 RepID=UPI00192A5AFA|nr:hypothetical protein [Cronobacter sakazakii]NCH18330.1 hypothetical protein [Cronobacter sakazakii]
MNNDELIAAGHELAKCLDSNTPLIDIAKLLSKMATQLDVTTAALREKTKQCEQLAAENTAQREFIATCFHAAGDGGDMDGADIQALGERLGLFGRETYQPVIHGYICGHEPGEDSVYVMKKNSATDAFLREVRASELDSLCGVAETMLVKFANQNASQILEAKGWEMIRQQTSKRAAKLRQGGAA